MSRHLIIPDAQIRPGDDLAHIKWAAQAIVEYKPDVIVVLGDWWDFPSLSSYDKKGGLPLENARYRNDVEAGNEAFQLLCEPMEKEQARLIKNKAKAWSPRKVFLFGNHEQRADRVALNDAVWEGKVGTFDCDTRDFERHEFLEIVPIDGIWYSHYFANTKSPHPIGGTISNRLAKIGHTFTQGHEQGFLYSTQQYPGDLRRHGLVVGSFYRAEHAYRGKQGQGEWRGIIVKNDVHAGDYDIMPLRMNYLERKYRE